MPRATIPPQVEIAALKKKVVAQGNLMQVGSGTPWEDRGAIGVLKAFFLTAFRSIFSPGKLWDELSRPETTRDSTAFACGCGFIVGVSWVVHSLWWDPFHNSTPNHDGLPPMLVRKNPDFDVAWNMWSLGAAVQIACAIFGLILLLRLANFLYQKMIPHQLASRIPPSLTYNVLAYAMGPALFTLIPIYGWMLALLWLLGNVIYGGIRRLSLGVSGGITSGILTMLVVVGVGFGAYFAGDVLWSQFSLVSVTYTPPTPPPGSR